ncbi:MAG: hypothetical protein V3T30_09140 [Thermodesulfobacteriota bacterium]
MERSVPITTVTESVRRMVIKTSRLPGLSLVYSGIYRAAVRAFVREVGASPCTHSIFSRNSYAAGTLVPGQSDLDILIVIRDDLAPSVVRTYLQRLYHVLEQLRRRFPMLNQGPVYTRGGFIAAYQMGPPRLEAYAWQCEWGDDDFLREFLGSSANANAEHSLDATVRVAQINMKSFHMNLRAALSFGKTHSTLAIERSARKVERALGTVALGERGTVLAKPGLISEIVARVLTASTEAVEGRALELRPHGYRVLSSDPGEVETDSGKAPDGINGILSRRINGGAFYLLSHPVSGDAAGAAITLSQKTEPARVVFTTDPIFTFFLRHINPLLYYKLKAERSVRGDDVLANMPPPSGDGVRRFFRFEAAQLLHMSTRLGSVEPNAGKRAAHYERRRARLFHFLRNEEFLVDTGLSPDTSPEPRDSEDDGDDILDKILGGMPGLLGELADRGERLFPEESKRGCAL